MARAVMIQREIPGDAEEPRADATFFCGPVGGSAYTDEHVLGQGAGKALALNKAIV